MVRLPSVFTQYLSQKEKKTHTRNTYASETRQNFFSAPLMLQLLLRLSLVYGAFGCVFRSSNEIFVRNYITCVWWWVLRFWFNSFLLRPMKWFRLNFWNSYRIDAQIKRKISFATHTEPIALNEPRPKCCGFQLRENWLKSLCIAGYMISFYSFAFISRFTDPHFTRKIVKIFFLSVLWSLWKVCNGSSCRRVMRDWYYT